MEHPEIQNSPLRCFVIANGELPMNNEMTATKNRMNTVITTAMLSIAAVMGNARNKTITAMNLEDPSISVSFPNVRREPERNHAVFADDEIDEYE